MSEQTRDLDEVESEDKGLAQLESKVDSSSEFNKTLISAPMLDLDKQLKTHFGFDRFHPGQKEVITSVLEGHPTLAVMPTGAGKSLCYQLPALCLDGVTIVISPLISLMKDQVDALHARGVSAGIINSSQSLEEQREVVGALLRDELKLLYIAPERFQNEHFMRSISGVKLSLIAVDEAHCISRWGHNFRPHYARLGEYISHLNPPRVMACTATATPLVSQDIVKTLRFESAKSHVAGFLRDNLFLEARLCTSEASRKEQLKAFIQHLFVKHTEGAIVIYSSTVKRVEKYTQFCREFLGTDQVTFYHGKLSTAQREEAQELFMRGDVRVVVATNAFGMGVDRADVRSVVHLDLPGTLEGYYQEVGRAGRDRREAHCLLLYMLADMRTHEFLISRSNPSVEHLQLVWNTIREMTHESLDSLPSTESLMQRLKRADEPIDTALRLFKSARLIHIEAWGSAIELNPQWAMIQEIRALPLELETMELQRFHELQNLESMLQFAQSSDCRHTHLLRYFGEGAEGECPGESSCDRCQKSEAAFRSGMDARGEICDDEQRITLKALSGVARAKGIYGQTKVIEMLSGSTNARFLQTFLKDLSTYAILKHLGSDACKELISIMMGAGLCVVAPRILKTGEVAQYKSLQLTPTGLQVMQGKMDPPYRLKVTWVRMERDHHRGQVLHSTVHRALSPMSVGGVRAVTSRKLDVAVKEIKGLKAVDETSSKELKEQLRRFRTSQARAREIPPYAIFSDAVLTSLISERPITRHAFLAIRGLGPAKWANYGEQIIDIIKSVEEED